MFGLELITVATISGALVFGLALALLGSLKLALAKRLALNEAGVGGLLSALNLALIPMMLISGLVIDAWGARWVLLLGSLTTTLGLFGLTAPPTYRRAQLAVLGVGLGAAAVSMASMVLMHNAFPTKTQAAALNFGCVFIALGALATPALTDVLLRALGFRRTVGLLAVLCLAPALFAALTPGDAFVIVLRGEPGQAPLDLVGLAYSPGLWLAAAVFFFYAPLEGTVGVWTTSYLMEKGEGEHAAAWMLSGFWASFLLSRLLIALWDPPAGWLPALLVAPPLLTAVALGNLSGTASVSSARLYLLALGFLLGPVFPTLVGTVFDAFKEEPGAAYGTMFAFGSLGSLALAPLIGARAHRRSVQAAFVIPMILALLMTAAALVFALRGGGR
jgi:fucose permease